MARYIIERTFPDGLDLPVNSDGEQVCRMVITTNSEDQVTWLHSYFSLDKKRSFCVYDAPTPEAIRRVARRNNLPVDTITEVQVLDPYFFH